VAVKKDQGARFAIEVDGIVRTHRDELTIAFDAAAVLREKNAFVRVVDTHTGQTVTQDPRKARSAAAGSPLFGLDSKPRR
jgi:hypothetical protein